jgi:hypothetical protein
LGAFAILKIPLDLSRRSAAAGVAAGVIGTYPGTRNVELDSATGVVSFEMAFPGNLSGLVRALDSSKVPVGDHVDVTIPVRNIAPEILRQEADVVQERLLEGPEVLDPEFRRGRYVLDARVNGDIVEASVVPSSKSMHELYDSLLTLGLVANDEADPYEGSAAAYAKVLGLL